MSIPNRRNHVRAPLSLEVIVEGHSGHCEARTSDIGLGGCYVDAMHEVAVGEILKLKAHLPDDAWICVTGAVVCNQWPTGFSMLFTELSDEARKALGAAITNYLRPRTASEN